MLSRSWNRKLSKRQLDLFPCNACPYRVCVLLSACRPDCQASTTRVSARRRVLSYCISSAVSCTKSSLQTRIPCGYPSNVRAQATPLSRCAAACSPHIFTGEGVSTQTTSHHYVLFFLSLSLQLTGLSRSPRRPQRKEQQGANADKNRHCINKRTYKLGA